MIKYFNLFFLFLIAPVLGFYFAFFSYENPVYSLNQLPLITLPVEETKEEVNKTNQVTTNLQEQIMNTTMTVKQILDAAQVKKESYEAQKKSLEKLLTTSKQQEKEADITLEKVLSSLLGDPIFVYNGKNATIKIYTLQEAGYRGYMAKIHPKTKEALKLILADDQVISNGETTSEAAKRSGGILAVNAGGFMYRSGGKITPLGTTVVDGEIKTFSTNPKLSFVGFNTSGYLVGGQFATEEEIKRNKILQGASFVPALLQDGKKLEIPAEWAKKKEPRTLVGNFSNNELLFIVIDGRRVDWSTGVTLEELQDKLLSFKIKDAFNLDGGGSSTFYFNGQVLNKPSDGKERPVTSNLVIMP